MYTMTLSDGTKLENLELNGNNWISKTKITDKDFEGKLVKVSATDGEHTYEFDNAVLVQIMELDNKYWFIQGNQNVCKCSSSYQAECKGTSGTA